jgi:hypothetical protein
MNKIPVIFFLIATGLILFILCLSSWGTKQGELFAGILSLYAGTIFLLSGIKKKKYTLYGLRFRLILTGIIGVIGGLVIVISYFT